MNDKITTKCPHCGTVLEITSDMIGGKGQCYTCESKFIIEAAPADSPEMMPSPEVIPTPKKRYPMSPRPSKWRFVSRAAIVGLILLAVTGVYALIQSDALTAKGIDNVVEQISFASNERLSGVKKGDGKRSMNELASWLRTRTDGVEKDDVVPALSELLKDPEFSRNLAAHELLRQIEPSFFEDFNALPDSASFLEFLFSHSDDLARLIYGHENGIVTPASVYTLYCIWKVDPDCLSHPVYRKLAVAFAIQSRGKFIQGETQRRKHAERYLTYKRLHAAGRLHKDFDTSSVIDMRQTLIITGRFSTEHEVQYLSDSRHHKRGGYAGACWAVAYRRNNTFGDSIHGRDYYWPWAHQWPGAKTYDLIGGICGSLSTYGAKVTQVHGIPSSTAGQPGHCAYVLKHEAGKWRVSNSVANPTTPYTYWRNHYSYLALKEAAFSDMEAVRESWMYIWYANLLRENSGVVFDVESAQPVLGEDKDVASTVDGFVPNAFLAACTSKDDLLRTFASILREAPVLKIEKASSKEGVTLAEQSDGSHLLSGKNPDRDVLTFEIRTGRSPVYALVLEFLAHESLPKNGPGRAGGNTVLTEVVCTSATGEKIPWKLAIPSRERKNWYAPQAIDGNMANNNGWSCDGGSSHSDEQLILIPEQQSGLPANTVLKMELHFISRATQHIPGCIRFKGVAALPTLWTKDWMLTHGKLTRGIDYEGTVTIAESGDYILDIATDGTAECWFGEQKEPSFKVATEVPGGRSFSGWPGYTAHDAYVHLEQGTYPFRMRYTASVHSPVLRMKSYRQPMGRIRQALYDYALSRSPVHMGIWHDYGTSLTRSKPEGVNQWQAFGKHIAISYIEHGVAAWDLLHQYVAPVLQEQGEDVLIAELLAYHERLMQVEPLRTHFGWIKNIDKRFEFFKQLMALHEGERSFWTVYNEGKQFGSNKQTADAYATFIVKLCQGSNEDGVPRLLTGLSEMILKLEKEKKFDEFRKTSALARGIITRDESIKQVHLNSKTFANYPALPVMPGKLLSSKAVLHLSRPERAYDRPIFHHGAISGDKLGYLCTVAENKPSATLLFPNKVQMQGISVVTRHEYPKGSPIPLTVKVSDDGKKWTDVTTFTELKPVLSFVLPANEYPDAKYVRIESDFGDKKSRLQLRGILVYGKAYY